MTTVYNADGTTLSRKTADSPLTYTAIPKLRSIRGLTKFRNAREITNLSSGGDEYMPGLPRTGVVTAMIDYDPNDTQHAALLTALANNTLESFRVSFPSSPAEKWTFSAYVIGFPIDDLVPDGGLTVQLSLRPTGALSIT